MILKVNNRIYIFFIIFNFLSINLGRTYLANGTRYDWWASPTVIGYSNSRRCITDYYINELKTITYNINNVPIRIIQKSSVHFLNNSHLQGGMKLIVRTNSYKYTGYVKILILT